MLSGECMRKFNLNDYVYFKPTQKGLDMYHDYYLKYGGHDLIVNEDGFAKLQFHNFINVYGHAISTAFIGSKLPFESYDIYFNEGEK